MRQLFALFVLLSVVCCGPPSPPVLPALSVGDTNSAGTYLQQVIDFYARQRGNTGLGMAVADASGLLWTGGTGMAQLEAQLPFTADTKSLACSLSKVITATAMMRLVEQGKIDLDKGVNAYLPNLEITPYPGTSVEQITIRRMMTHQSGLPALIAQGAQQGDQRPLDYPHSNRMLATLPVTASQPPDTAFAYSNYAVSLLGLIVEAASGMNFEDFVQKEIFDPAAMARSSMAMPMLQGDDYARGYTSGVESKIDYLRDIPAGGMVSTAADLGRFASKLLAIYNGQPGILQPTTLRQMWTPQNTAATFDDDFRIGLMWWMPPKLDGIPGERVVLHMGDINPFHGLLILFPDRDLAIALLVNSADDGTDSLGLFDSAFAAARAFALVKGQQPIAPAEPRPKTIGWPSGQRERYEGTYTSGLGMARIKSVGNGLMIWFSNNWLETSLYADGRVRTSVNLWPLSISVPYLDLLDFTFDEAGGDPLVNFRIRGMRMAPLRKLKPVTPPAAWMERIGDYEAIDPQGPDPVYKGHRLKIDSATGAYCLERLAFGSWKLYPLEFTSDTEARLSGVGRDLGDVLRAGSDGTLAISGMRLRKK